MRLGWLSIIRPNSALNLYPTERYKYYKPRHYGSVTVVVGLLLLPGDMWHGLPARYWPANSSRLVIELCGEIEV